MADHGWGAAPAATEAKAEAGPWGTADLKSALSDTNGHSGPAPVEQAVPPKLEGWVEAEPYHYDEFANRETEWDGQARIYEWDGEEGDIGPELPELEDQLFGPVEQRGRRGIDFSAIAELQLVQEGPTRVEPIDSFRAAGLHPAMLRNVELAGYDVPTPIQRYCVPAISQGHDVIAIAQTGSGKTAAYMIPIINKLMGKAKKLAAPRPNPVTYQPGIDQPCRAEPLVVVVCPSRELAVQIFNEARKFCYRSMLRPCVIYGGGPMREQMEQIAKGCDILVASPGRLIDFMDRPDILSLRRVRYMVIDEADEMLHDDWKDELDQILSGGDQEEGNIKYMLFSATFPKAARDLATTHLADNHVRLRVGRAGSTHSNIKQDVIWVEPYLKKQACLDLLNTVPPGRTIIFVNSKRAADELDDFLFNKGVPCVSMHSDRTQREREAAMRAFRAGRSPVLITTAVTARGIDVRNVLHVINFDLPSTMYGGIEEYVHRIGRTGRIGHRGLATSFYTERDEDLASVLTRTLLETGQEVPDFLQQYIPEDTQNLHFEADSDFEEDVGGGGDDADGDDAGGGWGGGGGADDAGDNAGGDGWGAGN
ncbi:DEAD-domain-containing protein [Neurospora crassa]|uniref:RNA helicase n=1 Tax=Neurospora crassa (strain ATCC 24698 / 74-OR23-1A / CBS 708.71 / DSM 1257 / FGSC 987) TaxID=367110 RepID=Q7SFQ7_NEUCR|nr:DEAD box RNA helicase-PL10B [Neurospora crassa OR74A]EAA35674.1 DEAD box RNA helicase-PL10B [Neurospora crassa OR74A]KHE82461.1 DEAD-domain-containing protein [Neurospora crassa]|eukprot:XP_964910.1 DEAD box RNA helicase-PL10B [Neurospora crassa OR74A]